MKHILNSLLSRFNEDKFWKMHFKLQSGNINRIEKAIIFFRLKRIESKLGGYIGHQWKQIVHFDSQPVLPHGISGIFISPEAHIGKNVCIYQQVSIAIKRPHAKGAATIGDNVLIGSGAKIIGPVNIGSNVNIGANAVVTKDIPDNCTVIGNPSIIIRKK